MYDSSLHISLFTSKEWRRGISGGRTILGDDHISVTLIFYGKRLIVTNGVSLLPTI